MAITQSPTRVVVLSPNLTKGSTLALIFRTARTDATSRPINFASYSLRLGRMTEILSTTAVAVTPDPTWEFVTMSPSEALITTDTTDCDSGAWGSPHRPNRRPHDITDKGLWTSTS